MPSSSLLSSLNRREVAFITIAFLAILIAVFIFWRYQSRAPDAAEASAQKAAESQAKAENPFSADNPLAGVETNPFGTVKKVLNPFEE